MYINDTHLSERGFGHDSIIHVNTVSLSDVVIYCSTLLHDVDPSAKLTSSTEWRRFERETDLEH